MTIKIKLLSKAVGLFVSAFCILGGESNAQVSPEKAATAMVDIVLPADWAGSFQNLLGFDTTIVKHIRESLENVLEKPLEFQDRLKLVTFIPEDPTLFKGGKMDTIRGRQYIARLKNLSAADKTVWKNALKSFLKVENSDWLIVYEMAQLNSLWTNNNVITNATMQRSLARLSSIPLESIEQWKFSYKLSDKDIRLISLIFILQTNELFLKDNFNVELFKKAIPFAIQKYKERNK